MFRVIPFNETFIKVLIEDYGVEQQFVDFFSFYVDGYKWSPAYKKGVWDGKTRLFNSKNKLLYKGLLEVVVKFCISNKYDLQVDESLYPKDKLVDRQGLEKFCDSLNLTSGGEPISVRDYQLEALYQALSYYRKILISPTGSGKSLIIYLAIRYLLHTTPEERIVLIVPTTSLVEQMFKDFMDYSSANGWRIEDNIQLLYGGKDKVFSKPIMISTWQSLHAMKKGQPKLFSDIVDNTTTAIFDEAHTFKGTEIRGTIEQFKDTVRRIGTTGTLDNSKVHELILTGLIGTPYQVKTTRELMDEGVLTNIDIKIVELQYPEHVCASMKGADYKTEIDFIIGCQERNRFITDLALTCKGATLITFAYVERHGKILYDMLKENASGRNVYYVSGEVDIEDREKIRSLVNEDPDSIVVASEKLFSTGINIPGLTNIITAHPRKSPILIRQTIGRGVRKFSGKSKMNLFDIADCLTTNGRRNHAMRTLYERIDIYNKEEFEYKTYKVQMSKFYQSEGLDSLD